MSPHTWLDLTSSEPRPAAAMLDNVRYVNR